MSHKESLQQLLDMIRHARELHEGGNEFARMNAVAWLGEQFIASESRFHRWETVLRESIEIVSEE